jgi:hypothetical protein
MSMCNLPDDEVIGPGHLSDDRADDPDELVDPERLQEHLQRARDVIRGTRPKLTCFWCGLDHAQADPSNAKPRPDPVMSDWKPRW